LKKEIAALIMTVLCITGCSAADNSTPAGDCAAPASGAREFELIQDFGDEVYGLAPETGAECDGEAVCSDETIPVPTCASEEPCVPAPSAASVEEPDAEPQNAYEDEAIFVYTIFYPFEYTANSDDSAQVFLSRSWIPEFSSEDNEMTHWLNDQLQEIQDGVLQVRLDLESRAAEHYSRTVSDSGEDAPFYTYSYYSDMNMGRHDDIVISLLHVNSVYSGGTHPNYVQSAYNFDLISQTQLELADVVYGDAVNTLLNLLLENLDEKLSVLDGSGFFADYKETVVAYFSDSDLTPYWYFSESGLVVYFNCYDIAPYAAGIIQVEMPYERLDGILRPEFFPNPRIDVTANLLLPEAGEGRSIISVPSANTGSTYLLGCSGIIYDVRLYPLRGWASSDTPIPGPLLFAANRLTSGEALELTQTGQGDLDAYILDYRTGAGEQLRYIVSDQQIRMFNDSVS